MGIHFTDEMTAQLQAVRDSTVVAILRAPATDQLRGYLDGFLSAIDMVCVSFSVHLPPLPMSLPDSTLWRLPEDESRSLPPGLAPVTKVHDSLCHGD
jgi:hypothetical protein